MSLPILNAYAHVSMAAPQGPARVLVGNHMELDLLGFIGTALGASDVELTTGADQLDGNITLKNHRYLVRVEMFGQTNEGTIQIQPAIHAGATAIVDEAGKDVGVGYLNDSNTSDQTMPCALHFVVDATSADVEFRLRFATINTAITNVDARVYVYKLGTVDSGATFDSYASVTMAADQTANVNVNDHVEWDTIAYVGTAVDGTNVLLSTGAGQADGTLTLKNQRYLIISELIGECSEGRGNFKWTDGAGADIADEVGILIQTKFLSFADNNQTDQTNGPASAMMILDASAGDIVMELRIWDEINLVAVYGVKSSLLIIPILES